MTPVELDSSALKSSVAFTGRLACMTRAEAFEVVRQRGGTPSEAVTKRTKLLIVGELGWPLLDDGRPSNKLSRATAYGIPVANERRFLEWIGKAVPDSVHKTYSADQLAALSKLSRGMILKARAIGSAGRAPWLFRLSRPGQRASDREFARGWSSTIRNHACGNLAKVRLHAGPHCSLEIDQPGGRTDQHGQFVLAVDQSQNNPDELFEQAQSAEEAGDFAEAERVYRILMKIDPTDASAPFNLGNLLRASARNVEAEAALRAATCVDPTFADAWYNLSDLLDEQGRVEAAIECLRTALRVAPDYADALFNLALLLQRTNQYAEAADYWRRYLATDRQSEWAARARRSLKFCEMQINLIASA